MSDQDLLQAEIQRLRTSLSEIERKIYYAEDINEWARADVVAARDIARNALKQPINLSRSLPQKGFVMIPSKVTVTMPTEWGNRKVSGIKALRELANLGLREAKEVSERQGPQQLPVDPRAYDDVQGCYVKHPEGYPELVARLKGLGVLVQEHTSETEFLDRISQLACEAVLKGHWDLSKSLIDVLKTHSG